MPLPRTKLFSPIQTQKDYRTFLVMDRHKVMAQACARYPELQLGDDVREWMKEIDNLDDYSEKLIEDIKIQQKIERDSITAENFRQLRETQIKIRGLIRRLKITVEQKSEVNDKIEKFLDEFSANIPLIFAETKPDEQHPKTENFEETPLSSTSESTTVVVTPQIIKNTIEILKREKEFAAEEWKIEESYAQANASKAPLNVEYEAEEYDLPPPPSSGRGRRPQLPTNSPKKSLNRSLASPRRAKKPASAEEMPEEDEAQPPPEKKSKTSLPAATVAPAAIIVSGKRRKSGGGIRKSSEPKTPKPPSTPEEIAARKEERAKVKKAKAEEQQKQQNEAEEIARLTAQLELEGDIPKRRAAATAAANAIHSAHIPKTPVTTSSSSKSIPKEKEPSVPATIPTAPPATTTTTTTTTSPSAVISTTGRKRSSMSKKVLRKSSQKDETEEEETYCICKEISYGEMICCDNEVCKIQWFHFGCVGLKIKPKRGLNWYCNDCRGEKSSILKKK
uniref:PHD-type domain-containing protein n=1 Tax=Panagrolaimus superbus TaxID=310955 RepID=A0A914ZD48_9BILA